MEFATTIRSNLAHWGAALGSPPTLALAALLALQLIAALAIGWGGRDALVPAAADRPLLDFDASSVQVLRIDGPGDAGATAVALARGAQGWTLKDLGDFPAEGTKVDDLLGKLAGLKRPMPVATSAESQKRHKVADDAYERRIVLVGSDDKPIATLLLGDSPGPRRQLARVGGETAVYDLDLPIYEVGDRPDDWLAKDRLHLDQETIVGIAAKDWELIKDQDNWRFADAPAGGSAGAGAAPDAAAVVNLLGRIANLGYRGVLGTQDQPEYNQSEPALELRVKLKNGDTRTYRISKPKEGQDHVLKASDQPWYFKAADFDLEGVIDQDRAKLAGAAPKTEAAAAPTGAAPNPAPAAHPVPPPAQVPEATAPAPTDPTPADAPPSAPQPEPRTPAAGPAGGPSSAPAAPAAQRSPAPGATAPEPTAPSPAAPPGDSAAPAPPPAQTGAP